MLLTQDHGRERWREMEEDDNEDDCLDSNNTLNEEGHDTHQDEAVEIVEIYKMEHSKLQAFYCETGKSKMGMGGMPCSATLTLDDITECRDNCSELLSAELDFAILGIIHSCNKTSPSGRVEKSRQSTRMCVFYHAQRICQETFLFVNWLRCYWFNSLVNHLNFQRTTNKREIFFLKGNPTQMTQPFHLTFSHLLIINCFLCLDNRNIKGI